MRRQAELWNTCGTLCLAGIMCTARRRAIVMYTGDIVRKKGDYEPVCVRAYLLYSIVQEAEISRHFPPEAHEKLFRTALGERERDRQVFLGRRIGAYVVATQRCAKRCSRSRTLRCQQCTTVAVPITFGALYSASTARSRRSPSSSGFCYTNKAHAAQFMQRSGCELLPSPFGLLPASHNRRLHNDRNPANSREERAHGAQKQDRESYRVMRREVESRALDRSERPPTPTLKYMAGSFFRDACKHEANARRGCVQ